MGKKTGPKPIYGEAMMTIKALRVTPGQKALIDEGGTPAFWRNIMESIATYKMSLEAGEINLEQYEQHVTTTVTNATIADIQELET